MEKMQRIIQETIEMYSIRNIWLEQIPMQWGAGNEKENKLIKILLLKGF